MLWRDVIDLINVSHSNDADVIIKETHRTVMANKKSVTRSEFYPAFQNNLKPSVTFEIRCVEYEEEQKLRHNGKDYIVIRSYSKNGETIDLICQAYNDIQANLAKLRDIVEIWRSAFVENSMGEESPSIERLYTVPATIDQKSGGTSIIDGTVIETSNSAIVTVTYRDNITPDMFLMISGQRWDIDFILNPYNRNETLQLTVRRVIT